VLATISLMAEKTTDYTRDELRLMHAEGRAQNFGYMEKEGYKS
jgi:hypothetical protein